MDEEIDGLIINLNGVDYVRKDLYDSELERLNGVREFNELLLKGDQFKELKEKLDEHSENFRNMFGDVDGCDGCENRQMEIEDLDLYLDNAIYLLKEVAMDSVIKVGLKTKIVNFIEDHE